MGHKLIHPCSFSTLWLGVLLISSSMVYRVRSVCKLKKWFGISNLSFLMLCPFLNHLITHDVSLSLV